VPSIAKVTKIKPIGVEGKIQGLKEDGEISLRTKRSLERKRRKVRSRERGRRSQSSDAGSKPEKSVSGRKKK